MSLLLNSVYQNSQDAYFLTANISSINTNSITANQIKATVGSISSLEVSSLYTNFARISTGFISSISTTSITLDGNTIDTAGSGFGSVLLLNGVPIATLANISSIEDWSFFPAVSTVQMNAQNLSNALGVYTTNLNVSATGNIKVLNSSNIVASNDIMTNTLDATGLITGTSISSIVLKGNQVFVSSLVGGNISASTATFSSLTGSIVFPSTISASNLSLSNLSVSTSATFAPAPTFGNGANFYGTRPNFTTGFTTSGANNLNFQNLDNASNVNGNVISVIAQNHINFKAENFISSIVDRLDDVGGKAQLNMTAIGGQGTFINIQAAPASDVSPITSQIINIQADSSESSITGAAAGGRVSIKANAQTGTTTSVLGYGQIDLTAFSALSIPPTPGLIKLSAGSVLSYAGLTVPTLGIYGSAFYSALNCLSLTAGISPATTSFPGVVYLRGDNGTKVVNGFYSDTITATGNSVLPSITGVNTINGSAYPPATPGIPDPLTLNVINGRVSGSFSTITASTINCANIGATNTISANNFSANMMNTLNINTTTINNAVYPPAAASIPDPLTLSTINGTVSGSFSTLTVSTLRAVNATASTLTISSINGVVYPPPSVIPQPLYASSIFTSSIQNTNDLKIISPTQVLLQSPSIFIQSATGATSINIGDIGIVTQNPSSIISYSRSTIVSSISTFVISPATFFSGDVRVSSISGYPNGWISTLNTTPTLNSTFDGTTITTPQDSGCPNIEFPYAGDYVVYRKIAQTKVTGGTAQGAHINLFIQRTSSLTEQTFPSNNGSTGLPYINDNDSSTFTTAVMHVKTTASASLKTWVYDGGGSSYTASIWFDNPVLQYTPPPLP